MANFLTLFISLLFLNTATAVDQSKLVKTAGCPINTSCNEELGYKRSEWNKLISEQKYNKRIKTFIKKQGIPFNYFTNTSKANPKAITWDSHCPNHNKENHKVSIAQSFIDNLNSLPKEAIQAQFYVLEKKSNKLKAYSYSQGSFPSFITDKYTYSNIELDGNYYALKVYLNGKLNVEAPEYFDKFPKTIKCSEQLNQLIQKQDIPELYSHFYCRQIWNSKVKSYQSAVFGKTCD